MQEEMAGTGEAAQQGTGPLDGPLAPGSGLRWRRVFPGEGSQLGALRRWLESLLPECPARDDVACVATELGTNAILHTASGQGGCFAVEVTWHKAVVRIAVADCGAPGSPRMVDDPAGEHGRGLLVVRSLAVRTGVCGDHRGRLVWADVPWDDAGAAKPASSQDPYETAIRDGQADLASRFAEVPAWFGRSTLQWWALAGGVLVTAPSAHELAGLLGHALDLLARSHLPPRTRPPRTPGLRRLLAGSIDPAIRRCGSSPATLPFLQWCEQHVILPRFEMTSNSVPAMLSPGRPGSRGRDRGEPRR